MTAQSRFKKVRNVTLPLLKMVENHAVYIKSMGVMFVGKQIDDKKEPATLMNVVNLETGEEMQIIVPTVLKGILSEEYPDDGYVGKSFEIILHKHMDKTDPSKLKYNKFTVAEVEAEDDAGEAGAGEKSGKKAK